VLGSYFHTSAVVGCWSLATLGSGNRGIGLGSVSINELSIFFYQRLLVELVGIY
jgi:hypothetical protein